MIVVMNGSTNLFVPSDSSNAMIKRRVNLFKRKRSCGEIQTAGSEVVTQSESIPFQSAQILSISIATKKWAITRPIYKCASVFLSVVEQSNIHRGLILSDRFDCPSIALRAFLQ